MGWSIINHHNHPAIGVSCWTLPTQPGFKADAYGDAYGDARVNSLGEPGIRQVMVLVNSLAGKDGNGYIYYKHGFRYAI